MQSYWMVDGKRLTDKEYQQHLNQKNEAQDEIRREAAELVRKLGEDYQRLTRLLREHPEVGRKVIEKEAPDEQIYQKLRHNLERANLVPRCRWIKQDGTACGSPQMRTHIYCFAHRQMMEARALALTLPALEDATRSRLR